MGQYWKIVNVDKRQKLPRTRAQSRKMPAMFGHRYAEQLVRLLTVPNLRPARISQPAVNNARAFNRSSPLIALPQEIVDAITTELDDIQPLVSLAVTCSYFWRVLLPRVRDAIIAHQAPWAGDRLVLVGDYAKGLPPTCMDFELVDSEDCGCNSCNSRRDNPLDDYIDEAAQIPLPLKDLPQASILSQGFSSADRELVHRLLVMVVSDSGARRPGVLRNLTKREYVRDQTLADSEYAYSLGEAMMTRLFHGNDSYGAHDHDWVGDRFDIGTEDHVTGDWTDKSEETIVSLQQKARYPRSNGLRAWVH